MTAWARVALAPRLSPPMIRMDGTHSLRMRPPHVRRRGLAASVHANWRCGDGSGGGGAE